MTPFTRSKTDCVPQKQPPANTAACRPALGASASSAVAGGIAPPEAFTFRENMNTPANTNTAITPIASNLDDPILSTSGAPDLRAACEMGEGLKSYVLHPIRSTFPSPEPTALPHGTTQQNHAYSPSWHVRVH